MRVKTLLFSLVAVATIVYPFVVYNSLNQFGPSVLSLVLFALLLARVILRGDYDKPEQYAQLAVVGSLCLLAAWRESEILLRFYPVAMSLSFAVFFAVSLRSETSLVERFARVFVQQIEPHQRQYMRRLSLAWAILLAANAAVAAYTAYFLSLAQWTLYNGFIAYFVIGGFALVELVFRHFYKRRHESREPTIALADDDASAPSTSDHSV